MNWFKRLLRYIRNEEMIDLIRRDHDRLLNDFMAYKTEVEGRFFQLPETYANVNSVADVFDEYYRNSDERIDSMRERFSNMLESTVESWETRFKNLEDLAKAESTLEEVVFSLNRIVDKHTKQIQRVEDRIGKNELMHVETDKTLNESFQSAMKSVTREASQFKKFAVRLAIDLANEKVKEIEERYKFIPRPVVSGHLGLGSFGYEANAMPSSDPETPSLLFTIFVNGEEKKTDQSILNFEEIVELAFPEESKIPGIDLYASYDIFYSQYGTDRIKMLPTLPVALSDRIRFTVEPV